MDNAIVSINEAARILAQQQARKLAEQHRHSIIVNSPSRQTEAAFAAIAEDKCYSEYKKQIIDCILSGHLVPVHPLAGTPSLDLITLVDCGMDVFVSIRFPDIKPAFEAAHAAIRQQAKNDRNSLQHQQPEHAQVTAATVQQQPESDRSTEAHADVGTRPPGKMPNVSVGKLAIRAAWQIECETHRAASADCVMTLLQRWADGGNEPETLVASAKPKRGVEWRTKNGKPKIYDIEACQKTLATWGKSRK